MVNESVHVLGVDRRAEPLPPLQVPHAYRSSRAPCPAFRAPMLPRGFACVTAPTSSAAASALDAVQGDGTSAIE
jgi:hypothetical protein